MEVFSLVKKEALDYFYNEQYNKALGILRRILKENPGDKDALYYLCFLLRKFKKWGSAKKYSIDYLKQFGSNPAIEEILGDVFFFEGDYKKAREWFRRAYNHSEKNSQERKVLLEKINDTEQRIKESNRKIKVALIVGEGADSFTDDLLERLSNDFWVRKFVIPGNKSSLIYAFTKALNKGILSSSVYNIFLDIMTPIKKIMNWADITWIEWANHIAVAASYFKRSSGKKLFLRLHRYEAFTEFPFLIKWKNVDGVIFVSNFMRNILESRGVDLKNIHVRTVYNGVDLERLKFKPRENGYNIGWVAHIILRKNLHIALEIIKKLKAVDPKYTLHVAGDFPDHMYEIYLKRMVKELDLEENVIFYGWVDDIDEWWEDKNYLLSTSIHESFGYNIVEAMAKGIKPIIHNFYDARELFPDELLFNTTDEAVEKITKGAYDSESYRKYVIGRGWTIEKQVSEFKKFLNTLIAEKGGFIE